MIVLSDIPLQTKSTREAIGRTCENCGEFVVIYHTSRSLEDSFEKLKKTPRKHSKAFYFFKKTLHKALEFQHGS